LIISIPRPIVNAAKCTKGEKMQNYADGEKIYLVVQTPRFLVVLALL